MTTTAARAMREGQYQKHLRVQDFRVSIAAANPLPPPTAEAERAKAECQQELGWAFPYVFNTVFAQSVCQPADQIAGYSAVTALHRKRPNASWKALHRAFYQAILADRENR